MTQRKDFGFKSMLTEIFSKVNIEMEIDRVLEFKSYKEGQFIKANGIEVKNMELVCRKLEANIFGRVNGKRVRKSFGDIKLAKPK